MITSIRNNNPAKLTLIPGVGRKTAERLVMELRDKVASLAAGVDEDLGVTAEAASVPTEDSMRADALSALLNLGYQKECSRKAVSARAWGK